MNRREFIGTLGALSLRSPEGPGFYSALIAAAGKQAQDSLSRQHADGGVRDEFEIPQPGAAAGFLRNLAAVYLAPESRLHREAGFLKPMERAAARLLQDQRPDGTIDLPTTNFGSPPDTAFVLEPLCVTLEVLRARAYPETAALQTALERFIRKAAAALVTGGIHTPNHRWVVVSALARCHHLFPDPRTVARIDEWLAEGIDQDAEGQYNERSTGAYNHITNNALMTAGRLLGRPALFAPVRRNLEALLYLIHPNSEVVTDFSRRQDRFQRHGLAPYYRACRFLARRDGNGRFAALADGIEQEQAARLGGELIYFLETPDLREDSTPRVALPADYEKFLPLAQCVHIRRGERSGVLLGGHSRFFSFRHGGCVVEAVRLASAFFGKGQFAAELRKEGGRYVLEQELEGPYYQPLRPEDRRADGNWEGTPRSRRAQSNVARLRTRVEIQEREQGFEIRLDVSGTERVPLAVEITLRPGGRLTGPGVDGLFLREGFAVYEQEGRRVRIGPGFRAHGWTQLRGAEPRLDGVTLYLTDFTPLKRVLQLAATVE